MRAGVVGTGFIGVVHVEALRRLGIEVAGVVGSSPERAREKPGLPEPYESYEALLDDDERRRRPHHDAEPPALPAGQGGARGRQARGLREAARADLGGDRRARAARRARAVSSTARTSTSASTASAARRASGCATASSAVSSTCTAATSRTGCSKDTDWNWRLDPEQGGELRAVADIGSHWLDLVRLRDGQARRERLRRPRDRARRASRADRAGGDVRRRGRRRRARRARDVDRGPRAHPAALRRRRRAGRSSSRR